MYQGIRMAGHRRGDVGDGSNEKNSVRANDFRFCPQLGHRSMQSACLKRAKSRYQGRDCDVSLLVNPDCDRWTDRKYTGRRAILLEDALLLAAATALQS